MFQNHHLSECSTDWEICFLRTLSFDWLTTKDLVITKWLRAVTVLFFGFIFFPSWFSVTTDIHSVCHCQSLESPPHHHHHSRCLSLKTSFYHESVFCEVLSQLWHCSDTEILFGRSKNIGFLNCLVDCPILIELLVPVEWPNNSFKDSNVGCWSWIYKTNRLMKKLLPPVSNVGRMIGSAGSWLLWGFLRVASNYQLPRSLVFAVVCFSSFKSWGEILCCALQGEKRRNIKALWTLRSKRRISMMDVQSVSVWDQESLPDVSDYLMAALFASIFPIARHLLDTFVFEVRPPKFHAPWFCACFVEYVDFVEVCKDIEKCILWLLNE